LATLETEISKHTAQYVVIKDAEESYSGYSSGAKILLGAIKDAQLKETKGILGSNLIVPEKFEVAIGAVLGEYIDAFILDSQNDIENALAILEKRPGKAALLPLDALLVDDSSLDYGNEDGVFGLAGKLISAPEALEPVLELLTRNALVVQDRKLAQKVIDKLRSKAKNMELIYEARVVTLAGEVFYVHGPVKTSSRSKPVSLSRQREGREFQQKLTRGNEKLEITKEKMSQVETNLSHLQEEEKRVERTYAAQLQVRDNVMNAHRQMQLEYDQLKRELEWQEEQDSGYIDALEEVQEKIQLTMGTIQELELRELEIEGQISHHLEQLRQYSTDDLQAELTHWRTRIAVLKQALSESKERQVEREKFLTDAAKKSEVAKASMKALIEDHHQTKAAIKSLKLANEEIAAQIESSRNLITPLEQAIEANEQELTQLLSLESKERLVSNQAEQNYTQARIAQVRKQEALDALRRQIEVDFGLVAFEYREDISGPTPLPLEGFVEDLPVLTELSKETEEALTRQRSLLRRVGPVNPEAQVEYQEVEERYQFLTTQVNDLQEAAADVQRVIEELDEIMEREFCNTFDAVAEEFHQIFGRLFGGGSARLVLTDPNDLTDTGIDIEARLPGRREQGLSLLSGGERSLTAVALVFALLRVSPTPFCVLDEVDAMLDEANVGRFRELLRELSQSTQFIMITHNRATVQVADIIYGVTMGRDSTSRVLSLKVDELEKVV
jgi:chromosome segregation protein